MFYELHELVVFINNAAQLIQDKQTTWLGNQNIRIFMWKQTTTLPPKTFRAKRVFRVWLDVILVTTRVQEKVPPALGPLSTSKLSVSWWGLLFPGTSVSLSIYLPQTEHLPSMHLSGPGAPQVWWTGTSIHSADCEADVFTSGFL